MSKNIIKKHITGLVGVFTALAVIMAFVSAECSYAASPAKDKKVDRTIFLYTQYAGGNGAKSLVYECSVSELSDMVEKNKSGYVYQYYKENEAGENTEHAVVATDTVPFDLLFRKAGLSKYWFSGSYLKFTTERGTDLNLTPGYDELLTNAYYYDESGSHSVPSGLAVSWREGELTYGRDSVKALVVNAPAHELPRLVWGVNEYQYFSRAASPGRMTDNITAVTIVYPSEPQQGADDVDTNPPDSALTVSIQNGDGGERVPFKSYTAAELRGMAEKKEEGYIYEYYSGSAANAVVATEVVHLDSILEAAGADGYWSEGAKLAFITNEGRYTGYYPTYEEIKTRTSYIGTNVSNEVPCGFALTWDSGVLTGSPDAVKNLASKASTTGNICFVYGIDYSGYRNKTAASRRMPTGVTEVTIVYTNKNIGKVFGDVSDDDWFARYVDYAYYNGLMNGRTAEEFDPYGNVTRGQFITVLCRAAGGAAGDAYNRFEDVPDDMYYRDPVVWGTETGIVKGVSDTRFDPDGLLSREQIASFLYRYAESVGADTLSKQIDLSLYEDVSDVSEYAYNALSWAAGSGLLNVQSPDLMLLSPHEPMRRADLAAAFSIFHEKFIRKQ